MAIVYAADPIPAPGEAVVRIEASAICGSEREALMDGPSYLRNAAYLDSRAQNEGHEACGVVLDPGSSDFRIGDRVGLAAVVGCDACDRCKVGQEIHCRKGWQYAAAGGWHSELAAVPAGCLLELPQGTAPAEGAMISGDTLGVAARAFRREPSGLGDCILILGLGPVGLGHLAVRVLAGSEVVVVEPSEYRRQLALKFGAVAALRPGAALDGLRPRLVFECSGRPEAIEFAFKNVDDCGTVHQSGLCHTPVAIEPMMFFQREISYTGDFYYAREDRSTLFDLVRRGVRLRDLCTHEVPASEAQLVVAEFLAARSGKVILRWD